MRQCNVTAPVCASPLAAARRIQRAQGFVERSSPEDPPRDRYSATLPASTSANRGRSRRLDRFSVMPISRRSRPASKRGHNARSVVCTRSRACKCSARSYDFPAFTSRLRKTLRRIRVITRSRLSAAGPITLATGAAAGAIARRARSSEKIDAHLPSALSNSILAVRPHRYCRQLRALIADLDQMPQDVEPETLADNRRCCRPLVLPAQPVETGRSRDSDRAGTARPASSGCAATLQA